jgi:biotin carboxyl carrier protein
MKRVEMRRGGETFAADVHTDGTVRIGDALFTVTPAGPGMYRVTNGTQQWRVAVAGPPADRWVAVDGQIVRLAQNQPPAADGAATTAATPRARARASHDLEAPMPATVMRVAVEPGDAVARGDTLIVLEAMKMELPIRAPRDGVVRALHCRQGDLVQPGVNLLDLE